MAAALPADVKSILEGTARYEVESLPRLEEVARAQLKAGDFELELVLAIVRLYQFYPAQTKKELLAPLLAQCLVHPHAQAFALACFMLADRVQSVEPFSALVALSEAIETGKFALFWTKAQTIRPMLDQVGHFDSQIRSVIIAAIGRTFKTIKLSDLASSLGVSADEASKQSISKGWTVAESMVKITHETAAVKAAEQIDFAQVASVLLVK